MKFNSYEDKNVDNLKLYIINGIPVGYGDYNSGLY